MSLLFVISIIVSIINQYFLLDSKSKDRSRKEESKRNDKKRSRTPSKDRSSKDSSLKKRTKNVCRHLTFKFHVYVM